MSAAAAEQPAPAAAPKKSKTLLLIVAATVLMAGGGGGAWFFLNKKGHDAAQGEAVEHKEVKRAAPTYMALENMVVNLADPGGERVAQIGITLDLESEKTVDQVKAVLPAIRSNVLVLISQRSSEELLKRDGKEKLAGDVVVEVARALGHKAEKAEKGDKGDKGEAKEAAGPVHGVLFSSFIVQ